MHTAKKPEPEIPEKIEVPDFARPWLPEPIQSFTIARRKSTTRSICRSFKVAGTAVPIHTWSMKFVSAFLEDRDPWPNAVTSRPTGPASASVPTNQRCKGGKIVRSA